MLKTHPGVHDAAIVVRRSDTGLPRSLVAYVALHPGVRKLLPRHIMAMASRRLPKHLLPAQIIIVDELPRLPNLKINRVRLAEIDGSRATRSCNEDLPLIDEVTRVFANVLGVSGATPEDDVRSLGGDSLQVVTIVAELERRFAIAIPHEQIEAAHTIGDLARWISSQRTAAAIPSETN